MADISTNNVTVSEKEFKPYIAPEENIKEFTPKALIAGGVFGLLFGAATVYLALKAGLTVSASIPVAVLAISIGRKLLKTTILENNIIQTTASAGESIASGVVFTLPGFLFLSMAANGQSVGAPYFEYVTIFILAVLGGILGTLMMIPLRRSLIVKEHGKLPYPEGTACASVLIAGEKGGEFAKTAYQGLGFAMLYALLQHVLKVIAAAPTFVTKQTNKFLPSATVSADITPEYMGVGYIVGFRIAGILVAGGVLAWLGMIPLLAGLVPMDAIAEQLVKLGNLKDIHTAGGPGNWNPDTHTFANTADAVYRAYIRQIGAGAVAAGGFMTLIKTIPTIIASVKENLGLVKQGSGEGASATARTDRDLSVKTVFIGSFVLVVLMALLPQIPGQEIWQKILIGFLVVLFGFFFVTVSSRIVGSMRAFLPRAESFLSFAATAQPVSPQVDLSWFFQQVIQHLPPSWKILRQESTTLDGNKGYALEAEENHPSGNTYRQRIYVMRNQKIMIFDVSCPIENVTSNNASIKTIWAQLRL
jgi:uncharacterized oligopeptide transporter (OPT) family protein